MNALWPSVAEERAMALADRAGEWRKDELITADQEKAIEAATGVPWKSNGMVVAAVFFVLTCLAVAFAYFLFDELHIPGGFVTLFAIAAAEGLIIGWKCFGTGVESALWLAGLLAFIFSLPHSGKPEALLVIAAAFAIAGVRMRNPLLVTAAAVIVIVYLGAREWPEAAIAVGVAAGIVALIASAREWRRPWAELLCAVLLIVMPVAGILTGAIVAKPGISTSWAAVYAVLAIAAIRLGVVTRQHAPLIGGFVDLCVVYGILQGNRLLLWSVETQAIVAGILILAISGAISRALRGRGRGITATPTRLGELEELSQLAGAVHVQHSTEPAAPPVDGGGRFGGAGATGDY